MEGTEGPFDHFWGPLNANDFETSKPFFESQLIDINDGIRDVNCHNLETSVAFDHHDPMKSVFSEEELIIKGSLAERRASKFGFNATKINWDHVSMSPVRSPVQSPYLTIPPGISPAALLESPVMLPNSQQSPTTGTFPMAAAAACDNDNSVMNSLSPGTDRDSDIAVDSFGMFKPPGDFAQLHCTYNARDQPTTSSKHPTDSSSTQRDTANFSKIETRNDNGIAGNTASISNHDNIPSPSIDRVHQQEPLMRECIKSETRIINPPLFEQEQKRVLASSTKTSNAGDGYCWRKYGQKHVKGSEYPRSYYKCNNSNCPVKKKVERSHDGEITEIIYNGAHNHPKPHLRLSLACQDTSSEMLDSCEVSESPKLESWTGWRCNNQLMTPNGGSDWIGDGFEGTSSNPALNEICDPSSSNCQEKSGVLFGSMQQTPENATTAIVSQNGDDQDGIMQEITSPSEDADGDESEPKRRKRETFTSEAYLPSRSTREPRIILQIESEIDVLDDGYRWRKYGQKVVKGNPNPRSYYKCTSAGCPVRKHVERASEDIKSVITTYEGKHNHEVPTTKAMGAPSVGHSPQNVSDNTNPALTLPRNPNATNPEMKVQDFPMHYQMKPALGNDFTRSSLLGDFVGDMKLGVPSSIYQMKFPPPLQSPMLYSNPFMRNFNGNEFHTSTFGAPLMHDLPMMNASRTPNMAVNGFHSRPGGVVQSSIGTTQQIKENDYRFYKPKEE